MIDWTTKADQGLMPHQQGGTRAAADSQNGTALHQASQIPGSGGFLPIFLPKEATQSAYSMQWTACRRFRRWIR